MKSHDVTIQMKPRQQYSHMVLFIFKYFPKWNLGFVLNFDFRHSWEWKGQRNISDANTNHFQVWLRNCVLAVSVVHTYCKSGHRRRSLSSGGWGAFSVLGSFEHSILRNAIIRHFHDTFVKGKKKKEAKWHIFEAIYLLASTYFSHNNI